MTGDLPVWVEILTVVAIGGLLFAFGPGAYRALKYGPKGTAHDWLGLATPVAIVVGILAVLVLLARA